MGFKDISRQVYDTIEKTRETIFAAIQQQKNSVSIPYFFHIENFVFLRNEDQKEDTCNLSALTRRIIYSTTADSSKLEVSVASKYYKNIVHPTLSQLLKNSGVKISEIKEESETYPCFLSSGQDDQVFPIKDLPQIEICWSKENIPTFPLPEPQIIPPPKEMQTVIQEAFKAGELCDVELVCKNGTLKAHKLVLGLASEIFKKMFSNNMKESRSGSINFKEFTQETIGAVLNFIYFGRDPFYDPLSLQYDDTIDSGDILKLRHLWRLQTLKDYAANQIGRVIKKEEEQKEVDYETVGKLGALHESTYLLQIYNCYRIRKQQPLPNDIKEVMERLKNMK